VLFELGSENRSRADDSGAPRLVDEASESLRDMRGWKWRFGLGQQRGARNDDESGPDHCVSIQR